MTDAGIVRVRFAPAAWRAARSHSPDPLECSSPDAWSRIFTTNMVQSLGSVPVADVDPVELVSLETEIAPPGKPARISLHLEDSNGLDRGSLGEVRVEPRAIR